MKNVQSVASKIILWHITPKITDEMTKNQTERNIEWLPLTISRKNGIRKRAAWHYYISNIKSKTDKLVDSSINAPDMPSTLPHINIIKYLW